MTVGAFERLVTSDPRLQCAPQGGSNEVRWRRYDDHSPRLIPMRDPSRRNGQHSPARLNVGSNTARSGSLRRALSRTNRTTDMPYAVFFQRPALASWFERPSSFIYSARGLATDKSPFLAQLLLLPCLRLFFFFVLLITAGSISPATALQVLSSPCPWLEVRAQSPRHPVE